MRVLSDPASGQPRLVFKFRRIQNNSSAMLLVTLCLLMSLPLAHNQRIIDGPEVCTLNCGFGAHIHFEATLSILDKQIHIPEDAVVTLECNVAARDVQKIKIVWTSPNLPTPSPQTTSTSSYTSQATTPQTLSISITQETQEKTTLHSETIPTSASPITLSTGMGSTEMMTTTQHSDIDLVHQLSTSSDDETTSQSSSSEDEGRTDLSQVNKATTTDSMMVPGQDSNESSPQSTSTEMTIAFSSIEQPSSTPNNGAETPTLFPNYDSTTSIFSKMVTDTTFPVTVFESPTLAHTVSGTAESSKTNSDFLSTIVSNPSEQESISLSDSLKTTAADTITGDVYDSSGDVYEPSVDVYESSGYAGLSTDFPGPIDSTGEFLLELKSASSKDFLSSTSNSHITRFRRHVRKGERISESKSKNMLELSFSNGSTSHYLNKITIKLQGGLTGDYSTYNFIVPLCKKRMEAPHDYAYECDSERFDLGDSAFLILKNITVVAFSDGGCTLRKSKLCGENNSEDTSSFNGVIIAGVLIATFSFAGITYIMLRKCFRALRRKRPEAIL